MQNYCVSTYNIFAYNMNDKYHEFIIVENYSIFTFNKLTCKLQGS